jgi:hypothetical protein
MSEVIRSFSHFYGDENGENASVTFNSTALSSDSILIENDFSLDKKVWMRDENPFQNPSRHERNDRNLIFHFDSF